MPQEETLFTVSAYSYDFPKVHKDNTFVSMYFSKILVHFVLSLNTASILSLATQCLRLTTPSAQDVLLILLLGNNSSQNPVEGHLNNDERRTGAQVWVIYFLSPSKYLWAPTSCLALFQTLRMYQLKKKDNHCVWVTSMGSEFLRKGTYWPGSPL